jgi:hypothetical protein
MDDFEFDFVAGGEFGDEGFDGADVLGHGFSGGEDGIDVGGVVGELGTAAVFEGVVPGAGFAFGGAGSSKRAPNSL